MTLVQWVKTNSRALGKVGLYATGGVLIGAPVIRFTSNLLKGNELEWSADHAIYDSYGIAAFGQLPIDKTKLRNGMLATGLGAIAILAARKI